MRLLASCTKGKASRLTSTCAWLGSWGAALPSAVGSGCAASQRSAGCYTVILFVETKGVAWCLFTENMLEAVKLSPHLVPNVPHRGVSKLCLGHAFCF